MPIYNGSSLPFYRTIKEQSSGYVPEGVWDYDKEVLTPYQDECSSRFSLANRIEHEQYLQRHPEIAGMLKLLLTERINHRSLVKDVLKHAALYLVRPVEEIDADLRKLLQLSPDKPYSECTEAYEDPTIIEDLNRIKKNNKIEDLNISSSQSSTTSTLSSSFLSILTSTITVPTPELIPTPELTSSQVFHNMISMQIDKAVYSRLNDANLIYDIAYVELIKAVEAAMEIPVIAIREDIGSLLNGAYLAFLSILDTKAKIAAQIAWTNRMKKKLKRTLRRHKNFRGFETPLASKSEFLSHESFKQPSQRSSEYPQSCYNRYPKCTEAYEDPTIIEDLNRIKKNNKIEDLNISSSQSSTTSTLSSSFLSILTSTITVPTPELIPTPELTSSQVFHNMISMQIDKAVYSRLNDANLIYDIAYVELIKAVEAAMEIPVIAIREDIGSLLNGAYLAFLSILDTKAKIAAQIAWTNRMKKKLKRTLRRHKNFRGFETPLASKSEFLSHESFKQPSQRSSEYPQSCYNRYPKDRFGIYLPRATKYNDKNITLFGCLQEDDIVQTDATSIKSVSSIK